jgi:ribosome-associated protein
MDDPMTLGPTAAIPLSEVAVRATRSSGPGGQHANTSATRIEASFDAAASEALTDAQKRLIIEQLGAIVTAVAQDERSQARNRELALERLQSRLTSAVTPRRPRRPTRPPAASVQRREADKRRQSERKRERRPPEADE